VIAEQGRAKRQNQSVSQENWDEGVGGVDIRRAHATVTCRGFHVPESLPLHFPTYCELVATITPWATAGARRVQIAYKAAHRLPPSIMGEALLTNSIVVV
jgi:hypothetical protein